MTLGRFVLASILYVLLLLWASGARADWTTASGLDGSVGGKAGTLVIGGAPSPDNPGNS
jgi:hypothetical protein